MRLGSFLTTTLGLVLSGGSVYFAQAHLLAPTNAAMASVEVSVVEVAVARTDIPLGEPILAHLVTTQKWPRDIVPPGAFIGLDAILPADGGEPRRARDAFVEGELLIDRKLSAFGEKLSIVQRLGTNSRAMAINVDAATAVGGFVTPGDFVDILLTQGVRGELRAATILQNIRVIGVDQDADETKDKAGVARTVTVEVTPDQGQVLALAQKAGTLSLSLRTLEAVEDKQMQIISLRDLLRDAPAPEAQSEGKRPTVTVRRGTEAEEVELR